MTVIGDRSTIYAAEHATVAKTDVPLIDLSQSIQILTEDLIREQQGLTLSEMLYNVSGVVPNNPAETVLANPLMRGFEAEIFVDGLLGYGDTAVIDPSSLVGVERIEVAKGPTSVLYGGGTGAPVGGLINVVTKTPKPEARYEIGLAAGSDAHGAVQLDINQPLTETMGLRIAAERQQSDDFIDNGNIERVAVYPSFAAQLSNKTDLILRSFYTKIEQLEYTGLPGAVAGLPGVDAFQFPGATDAPPTEIENQSVHLTLNHTFNDTWAGNVHIRYFDNHFDEWATWLLPLVLRPPAGAPPGTPATVGEYTAGGLLVDTEEITVDASVTAKLAWGVAEHNFLIGMTLDETEYEGSFTARNVVGTLDYAAGENTLRFDPALACCIFTGNNEYATAALYIQDHITLAERVHIMLSARYSHYEIVEDQGFGPSADETLREVDPRVGVSYSLSDKLSLFAGFATGSRLPLFFGANSRPPQLEGSEAYELGIKFNTGAGGLSGTLAAYQITRDNVPTSDPDNRGFSIQGGELESRGVEVDMIWEPDPSFSLLANLAYTDAEVTKSIESFGAQFEVGNSLARVPETSGRIAARYRFVDGVLQGFGVGAGVTYAGEAPLTDANRLESDSYSVVDLQAEYQLGSQVSLALKIVNLLDEDYFTPYQYFNDEFVRPGQPRAAYLSVRAEF
ncbi:TonB-dependent siderophore receptor [Exilibacterium tricleocarpae]|nr:TonB-dependent siderophore receptor [Exilibacterium tricleocarpae]